MYIFLYFLIGLLSAVGFNVCYPKEEEDFSITMFILLGWPLLVLIELANVLHFGILKLANLINKKLGR